MSRTIALAGLALLCVTLCQAAPLTLVVAPEGSRPAADDGARVLPSLVAARDESRRLKQQGQLPPGGVTVKLLPGRYFCGEVLQLGQEDSGTAEAPVVYASAEPLKAILTGCKAVTGFTPVNDPAILSRLPAAARGKVLQCDLKAQGLTEYGAIGLRTQRSPKGTMELFCDGRPMTLARWPNQGFVQVASAPKGPEGGVFAYYGEEPRRWVDEPDARACGYWAHDWASSHVAIERIDLDQHLIYTKAPHSVYGYRKGGRFFAYNLLSELDEPGEYYIARDTGMLYFWPPVDIHQATLEVSVGPGFLALNNASHITFRGLTFEGCRGDAITIRDGSDVHVVGCALHNLGGRAVTITNGTRHRVAGCDIYDLDEAGITVSGGDRDTLTPCNHEVTNCLFTRLSRWQRTYAPAVGAYGVGVTVAHNLMYDIPHIVVLFSGNDHRIAYNEVHSIGYENGEMGAFYCGRNWTLQGNVIDHNYLHDIYNPCPQRNRAFMLDDGAAGLTMTNNVIVRVAEGISLSSYDNVIDNNVFVDCQPAIGCWGGAKQFPPFDPQAGHNPTMWPPLAKLALDQPPWSTRFPELLPMREAIRTGGPVPPQIRTRITHNVISGGPAEWIGFHRTEDQSAWVIENNLTGTDPKFVDAVHGNYRLRPDSPALELGIKPIDMTGIGLRQDAERASWPVVAPVRQDVCHNLTYVAPPKPPAQAVPPLQVSRLLQNPTIDGVLSPGEWPGEGFALAQDAGGDVVFSPSQAWVAHDGAALYVAFRNPVNGAAAMALDAVWGKSEAVEVAVRRAKGAPILVLRGFANGSFGSSDEAGAPDDAVKRAQRGVQYAAKVDGAALWTCEWRIPFASLGIDPATDRSLAANLTVRKVVDNLWVMWVGTGGRSWELDHAGQWNLTP